MTTISYPADPAPTGAAPGWAARFAPHLLGAGLLLTVIVALPVAPTDLDRHQLPKETVAELTTWLAFLLVRPSLFRYLRPAATWALAALLLAAVASGFGAHNGWLAFRATALMFTGVAAFAVARELAARGEDRALLAWCAAAGVVGAASGLAQAYGFGSPLFAPTRIPGGTFGNRNFMAHFSALTLPLVMTAALGTRRRVGVMISALGCALLTAAVILSRSRAAWIASAVAVTAIFAATIIARQRQLLPPLRYRWTAIAGAMLLAAGAAVAIPNHLTWRSNSPYSDTLFGLTNHDEGSGRGRMLQYTNTLHLAERHPLLGVGPGNWSIRYHDVAPPSDPSWVYGDVIPLNPWPSSDWMALLSEAGFIALFAGLLLGADLAWRAVRAVRTSGDRTLDGAALLAILLVAFITGSLDAVLLLPAPILLVAVSVGALLVRADDSPRVPAAPAPARWVPLLTLLLALCLVRSALQTTAYAVAGSGRSLSRLQWAARIDPASYAIRIALAERLPCAAARAHIVAAARLAPDWPASIAASRRCGVKVPAN